MDKFQKHYIHKIEFEIDYPDKDTAYKLKNQLISWIKNDLDPKINKILDEFSEDNRIIELDTISIDLGTVSKRKLKDSIVDKLPDELRKKIKYLFNLQNVRSKPDDERVIQALKGEAYTQDSFQQMLNDHKIIVLDPKVAKLKNLKQFMETGTLPASAQEEEKTMFEIIEELKAEQKEDLLSVLQTSIDKKHVRERIVRQIGDEGFPEFIKLVSPYHFGEIVTVKEKIVKEIRTQYPDIAKVDFQKIEAQIKEDVIQIAKSTAKGIFDKKEFTAEIISRLSDRNIFIAKTLKKRIGAIIGLQKMKESIADQLQDLVDKLSLAFEGKEREEKKAALIASLELEKDAEFIGEIMMDRAFMKDEILRSVNKARFEAARQKLIEDENQLHKYRKHIEEEEDRIELEKKKHEKTVEALREKVVTKKSKVTIDQNKESTTKIPKKDVADKAEPIVPVSDQELKDKIKKMLASQKEKKESEGLEIDMDDWSQLYTPADIMTFVEGQDLEQLEEFFQELERRRAEKKSQDSQESTDSVQEEPKRRIAEMIFIDDSKQERLKAQEKLTSELEDEIILKKESLEEAELRLAGKLKELADKYQIELKGIEPTKAKQPTIDQNEKLKESPSIPEDKETKKEHLDNEVDQKIEKQEDEVDQKAAQEMRVKLQRQMDELQASKAQSRDGVDEYYDREKEQKKLWQILMQIEEFEKEMKERRSQTGDSTSLDNKGELIDEEALTEPNDLEIDDDSTQVEEVLDLDTFVKQKLPMRKPKRKTTPVAFNNYEESEDEVFYPTDLPFSPRKKILEKVKVDRVLDIRLQRIMDIFQHIIFYNKAPWWSEEREINQLESDIVAEMASLKDELTVFFSNLFYVYSSVEDRKKIVSRIYNLFSLRFIDQLFSATIPKSSKFFNALRKWIKRLYIDYSSKSKSETELIASQLIFTYAGQYLFSSKMNVRYLLQELKTALELQLGITKRIMGAHFNQFIDTEGTLYAEEKETAKRYWKSKAEIGRIRKHKEKLSIIDDEVEEESYSFQDALIYLIQFGALPPASQFASQAKFEKLLLEYIRSKPKIVLNILKNAERENFVAHTFFAIVSDEIFEALVKLVYPTKGSELLEMINRILKVRNTDLKMKFYISQEIYKIHLIDYVLRFNESTHTVQNYIKDLVRFMVREKGLSPRLSLEYFKRIFEFVVYNDDKLEEIMAYLKIIENNIAKLPRRHQVTEPEPDPFDVVLPEVKTGTEFFVRNAGLVVLWPFFSTYFSRLGMLGKDKKFLDEQSQVRAAHLLQYLVAKQTQTPEFELVLNKVLVGLDPSFPLEMEIELSEKEFDTSESLLNSVVKQWSALKGTSIDGLRGAFLVRDGKLTKRADSWLLQVETKPYDILLDKMPWGIGMVRISWMDMIMRVEWR